MSPPVKSLRISEQQIPGLQESDADENDTRGLPDACVFTDEGWVVVFECKAQAHVSASQLRRRRKTAIRHGFESPLVVVIAVDEAAGTAPDGAIAVTWRDVYRWFSKRSHEPWARELVQYMQTFERKMLAKDYEIRGTITVFDGLRFDDDHAYTYREGKRLIRPLGDQLQARKDLHKIGVDPKGKRRPAITGRWTEGVWDFLPLDVARDARQFTSYPHLTMYLDPSRAVAAVTVPNASASRHEVMTTRLLKSFHTARCGWSLGISSASQLRNSSRPCPRSKVSAVECFTPANRR